MRTALLVSIAVLFPAAASAQLFNVDISTTVFPPGVNLPAPTYGAAAGQSGAWNEYDSGPLGLVDISGAPTGVVLTRFTPNSIGGGWYNSGGSPDWARLMDDYLVVGPIFNGGSVTYTLNGLANGNYQVYTYAALSDGGASNSFVTVPGSTSPNPQHVVGNFSVNSFVLGRTHSIHNVLVSAGTLSITVAAPPDPTVTLGAGVITGFQIVPAPASGALLALAALWHRRRRAR